MPMNDDLLVMLGGSALTFMMVILMILVSLLKGDNMQTPVNITGLLYKLSVIAMLWLIALDVVVADTKTIVILVGFVLMGLFASAIEASANNRTKK